MLPLLRAETADMDPVDVNKTLIEKKIEIADPPGWLSSLRFLLAYYSKTSGGFTPDNPPLDQIVWKNKGRYLGLQKTFIFSRKEGECYLEGGRRYLERHPLMLFVWFCTSPLDQNAADFFWIIKAVIKCSKFVVLLVT